MLSLAVHVTFDAMSTVLDFIAQLGFLSSLFAAPPAETRSIGDRIPTTFPLRASRLYSISMTYLRTNLLTRTCYHPVASQNVTICFETHRIGAR